MKDCLDLGVLAREIGLPFPAKLQQRAGRWLEGLVGTVHGRGEESEIDLFDALRSQLIIQSRTALADYRLARAVAARTGGKRPAAASVVDPLALQLERRALDALYLAKRALARRLVRWSTRTSSRGGGGDILAVPRQPGHLSDLLPVVRQFRERHGMTTRFGVVDSVASRRIRREGHPVVHLHALGRVRRGAAAALVRRVHDVLADPPHAARVDLDPGELATLGLVARSVVRVNLPDLLRVQAVVETVLRVAPLRAVVVGNPYTFEGRTAALVARSHGLPTACIEHGSIAPRDPRWARCPVDLVCAWGSPSRDALLACGLAPKSIAVTGAPRLDEVVSPVSRSASTLEGPYLLVATSGPGDSVSLVQHLDFIARLYRAAEICRLRFLVKLHPKDRRDHYREAVARHPGARVELRPASRRNTGLEIFDFLRGARALITVTSTAAVDAMVVGVPVIVVAPFETRDLPDLAYLAPDLTLQARTADDLACIAVQAWEGAVPPSIRDGARRYSALHFANPGRAAEAAAQRIAELAWRRGEDLSPASARG